MSTHGFTKDEVSVFVDKCFQQGELFITSLGKVIEYRMWEDLGYVSFHELATAKGLSHLSLPAATRQMAIEALHGEGASNRQIAEATGVSESTAHRAKRQSKQRVSNDTPIKHNKPESITPKIIDSEAVIDEFTVIDDLVTQLDAAIIKALTTGVVWEKVGKRLGRFTNNVVYEYYIKCRK